MDAVTVTQIPIVCSAAMMVTWFKTWCPEPQTCTVLGSPTYFAISQRP